MTFFLSFFQLKSIGSPRSPIDNKDTKSCERGTKGEQNGEESTSTAGSSSSSSPPASPMQRVLHLERNMAFMREQHRQMLVALQEEVDSLKRKNQGTVSTEIVVGILTQTY